MWVAWDDDLILNEIVDDDTILYRTRKEALRDISDRYEDARQHLEIRRLETGCYIYYPKSCDGEYGNEVILANLEQLKNSKYKETFLDLLEYLINECQNVKKSVESKNQEYKYSKQKFLDELINIKNSFN